MKIPPVLSSKEVTFSFPAERPDSVKLSVVTPSFNQLPYLKLCVASVADQGAVETEHIIQDAGSGGDLEMWAKQHPTVRVFVESDEGMYDAINRGLRRATGEICAYLNCDEQYLPGTLSKVEKFFVAHPSVDVVFGDVILTDKGGTPFSYRRTVLPTLSHVQHAHLNTPTCATFFRRTLLDRGFYFDTQWKVMGDAVWMENLLKNKVKMATLSEPLAVFSFTGKNLGQTDLSYAEALRWKPNERMLTRRLAILRHRARKTLAGAYRRRRVEIDIYTLHNPDKRTRIVEEKVGFGWPS